MNFYYAGVGNIWLTGYERHLDKPGMGITVLADLLLLPFQRPFRPQHILNSKTGTVVPCIGTSGVSHRVYRRAKAAADCGSADSRS